MRKLLLPVDGSDHSLSAVRHVIKLHRNNEPLEIHLLNVQPPVRGDVTAFVPQAVVDDFHIEEGEKALAAARTLLDDTGVPYRKHIHVGNAAEVIAHMARDLRCDEVIMGTHGFGTVAQVLLGSVSHEAIHQMDPKIPVTLIKAENARAA
jgi:nucleotide-binding universal stress UspA family protein